MTDSKEIPAGVDGIPLPDTEPDRRATARRVLVIDDEPSVGEMIRNVLCAQGFEADVHAGGESALDVAQGGDYGLIISDFAIPDLNGLEFARRFHALCPTVNILIVSAFLDGETEEALSRQPNVLGLVRKPFDIFDLSGRVAQAFEEDDRPLMALEEN